jgi:FMN phosphatase YigB (HAD superfamily)
MNKTLLFDFDGVIMRNNNVYKEMNVKSTKYLADRMKISYKKAENLQKEYLSKYGHTSNIYRNYLIHQNPIINKPNKVGSVQCFIDDYTNHVFSSRNMNELLSYITNEDIDHIHNLYEIKRENDLKYHLFSNASIIWIDCVIQQSNIDLVDFFDSFYTSDNNILKPNLNSYKPFHNNLHNVLIEDNYENIMPIKDCDNWESFHLKPSAPSSELYKYLDNIKHIKF